MQFAEYWRKCIADFRISYGSCRCGCLHAYLKNCNVNCDVLFLDDLGSENKIKNVTNEYLYLVLNERMLNHKKTVITTNLNLAQIQDVYGERIFSRLMHKKHSLKIKMEGKDLRVGLDEK